jgi:hypothetical protein
MKISILRDKRARKKNWHNSNYNKHDMKEWYEKGYDREEILDDHKFITLKEELERRLYK